MTHRLHGLLEARWLAPLFLTAAVAVSAAQVSAGSMDPVVKAEREGAINKDALAKLRANDRCLYLELPRPFPVDELVAELEKLVAAGNPEAIYRLGVIKYEAAATRSEGQPLIQKAAEQGLGRAQNYWAYICLKDKKDPASAEEWWRKTHASLAKDAEKGDLDAMFILGVSAPPAEIKDDPDFPPVQKDKAMKWLEKAAAAGHLGACFRLAKFLGEDSASKSAQEESWKWYNQAAGANYRKALVDMGIIYEYGYSKWKPSYLGKNHAKAWEMWDKAIAIMGENEFYGVLPLSREELPPRGK
jgi:TPR repeat protein